jgi:ferric-dicitrate binding protein FerR (iron transport regulator)
MPNERIESLIYRYLDGDCPQAVVEELRQAIEADPKIAKLLFRRAEQLGDMAEVLRAEPACAVEPELSVAAEPRTAPGILSWSRWLGPLAAAASLAILAGAWWAYQGRMAGTTGLAAVELRVAEVRGTATIENRKLKIEDWRKEQGAAGPASGVNASPSHQVAKVGEGMNTQQPTFNTQHPSVAMGPASGVLSPTPLRVGDILKPGDGVEVGADGFVKMAYLDGTRVELERNTRLRVTLGEGEDRDAKRLALDAGKMTCEAVKQPKPFEIWTRYALSTVVGTRFNIEVFDAKTALTVSEGKVQIERDGQTLLVGSNQTAEASDQGLKMLPPPVPRDLAVTVIRKVGLPIEAHGLDGIAFDGSVLWGCMTSMTGDGRTVSKLYKLDPVTGRLLGTVDVSACVQNARGLDWDGVNLWIGDSDGAKLVAVNPATGRPVKTLNLVNDFALHGLVVGDGYLWVGGGQRQGVGKPPLWSVRKLDLSSGALVASWPLPAEVREAKGLEYFNGALWTANGETGAKGKVFKLTPADGTVLGSFATPEGDRIQALAKSGTARQMWMVGRDWVYLVDVGE